MNIPVKANTIFVEFEKANKKIFTPSTTSKALALISQGNNRAISMASILIPYTFTIKGRLR